MDLRQKGLEKWLRKTSRSHPVMPVRDNLFLLMLFISFVTRGSEQSFHAREEPSPTLHGRDDAGAHEIIPYFGAHVGESWLAIFFLYSRDDVQ